MGAKGTFKILIAIYPNIHRLYYLTQCMKMSFFLHALTNTMKFRDLEKKMIGKKVYTPLFNLHFSREEG